MARRDDDLRIRSEGAWDVLDSAQRVFEEVSGAAQSRSWRKKLHAAARSLEELAEAREQLGKLKARRVLIAELKPMLDRAVKQELLAARALTTLAASVRGAVIDDPAAAAKFLLSATAAPRMEARGAEQEIRRGHLVGPRLRRWLLTTQRFALEGPGNESGEVRLSALEHGRIEYRHLARATLYGDRVLELRGAGARNLAARLDIQRRSAFRHPYSPEISVWAADSHEERRRVTGMAVMVNRWAVFVPARAYLDAIATLSASARPVRSPGWWTRANLLRHTTPLHLRRLEVNPPKGMLLFKGDDALPRQLEIMESDGPRKVWALESANAFVELSYERGTP